jgi:hypothetical protein
MIRISRRGAVLRRCRTAAKSRRGGGGIRRQLQRRDPAWPGIIVMSAVVLPAQWLSASLFVFARLGRLLDRAKNTRSGPPPPPPCGDDCVDDIETHLMIALICATYV